MTQHCHYWLRRCKWRTNVTRIFIDIRNGPANWNKIHNINHLRCLAYTFFKLILFFWYCSWRINSYITRIIALITDFNQKWITIEFRNHFAVNNFPLTNEIKYDYRLLFIWAKFQILKKWSPHVQYIFKLIVVC